MHCIKAMASLSFTSKAALSLNDKSIKKAKVSLMFFQALKVPFSHFLRQKQNVKENTL